MTVPEWREESLCRRTPIDWWYPVDWRGGYLADLVPAEAEALCDACPVRSECYEHALHHERHGVFAGIHELRRAELRRDAGIRLRTDPDPVAEERAKVVAAAMARVLDEDDEVVIA